MKLTERQHTILEWIRQTEHLEVELIAQRFDVTTQTIRKDINQLCEYGLLRRRHGGVSLPSSVTNLSFTSRQIINQHAKQRIASHLASLIPDNASVFLGIGTTIEFVARELSDHKGLTVLTNNLNVASLLCNSPSIQVMVAGGQLRHNDHDVVGEETTRFFSEFHADYGVIGTGGLDIRHGLMDFDVREAAVSRAILSNCRQRILVADQSKWGRNALAKIAPLTQIDLFITDHLPATARSAIPDSMTLITTDVTTDITTDNG